MNKDEVKKLMNYIAMNYNTFKVTKENYEYWCNELSHYDYDDIRNRLKEMMSDEKYAYQPPFLEALTRGLTKKDNKVNLDEITYYCQFCKRPFTDKSELDIHEDRCSAIRYIRRQYQRFGWYKLSGTQIKEMYNMPEEVDSNSRKEIFEI